MSNNNPNNTNPNNPPKVYVPRKIDWPWRDSVIDALKANNIPRNVAEVSVIDLRPMLDDCQRSKMSIQSTIKVILPKIYDIYNKGVMY